MLFLVLATATLGACDRALSPGGASLARDDAQALAADLDEVGTATLPELSASSAPTPVNVTFNRTAACPAGGQVTLAGTVTGQRDRDTRTVETETTATKTLSACAVTR